MLLVYCLIIDICIFANRFWNSLNGWDGCLFDDVSQWVPWDACFSCCIAALVSSAWVAVEYMLCHLSRDTCFALCLPLVPVFFMSPVCLVCLPRHCGCVRSMRVGRVHASNLSVGVSQETIHAGNRLQNHLILLGMQLRCVCSTRFLFFLCQGLHRSTTLVCVMKTDAMGCDQAAVDEHQLTMFLRDVVPLMEQDQKLGQGSEEEGIGKKELKKELEKELKGIVAGTKSIVCFALTERLC